MRWLKVDSDMRMLSGEACQKRGWKCFSVGSTGPSPLVKMLDARQGDPWTNHGLNIDQIIYSNFIDLS